MSESSVLVLQQRGVGKTVARRGVLLGVGISRKEKLPIGHAARCHCLPTPAGSQSDDKADSRGDLAWMHPSVPIGVSTLAGTAGWAGS